MTLLRLQVHSCVRKLSVKLFRFVGCIVSNKPVRIYYQRKRNVILTVLAIFLTVADGNIDGFICYSFRVWMAREFTDVFMEGSLGEGGTAPFLLWPMP